MKNNNTIQILKEALKLKLKIEKNWDYQNNVRADFTEIIKKFNKCCSLYNEEAFYYLIEIYCTKAKHISQKNKIIDTHKKLENFYLDSLDKVKGNKKALIYKKLANIFSVTNFFTNLENSILTIYDVRNKNSKILDSNISVTDFRNTLLFDLNFSNFLHLHLSASYKKNEYYFIKYSNLASKFCNDLNLYIDILYSRGLFLLPNLDSINTFKFIKDKNNSSIDKKIYIINNLIEVEKIFLNILNHSRLKILNKKSKLIYKEVYNNIDLLTEEIILLKNEKFYKDYLKINKITDTNTKLIEKKIKKVKKKSIEKTKKESLYVAIDFETANNDRFSACEIGYALFTREKIIDSNSLLIKPPSQSFYFTDIHNITWEDVQNEPTFDEIWPIIYSKCRIEEVKFIAAHNASFDRNVLEACCDYYSIKFPRKKFICTYRNISSKIWSFENNRLDTVCRNLKIPLDHHKGKSDAEACAKIVIKAFNEGWDYI